MPILHTSNDEQNRPFSDSSVDYDHVFSLFYVNHSQSEIDFSDLAQISGSFIIVESLDHARLR